jgi:hypothetical protein
VALLVLSTAAFVAAPGVFAASPQEIYDDYADNGRLDSSYSKGDLEKALTNAVVQGYGSDKETGLKPEIEEEINEGTTSGGTSGGTTSGGTAGESESSSTPSATTTSEGLPFTGLDLGLIAAGAAGLLLLGVGLRRVARQRP